MAFAENPFKYANARGTSFDKYSDPTQAALTVGQSARFDASSHAYLNRTPANAGNRKTFTWSGWVKRGSITSSTLLNAGDSNGPTYTVLFFNGNGLQVNSLVSSALSIIVSTTAVYRDLSAWYHVVFSIDTTQATNSNGVKIWVNGVQQALSFTTYTQNADTSINNTVEHRSGSLVAGAFEKFDGYLAEVNFIDGQALGPESFGYQDPTTKQWLPRTYDDFGPETDYGGNGFRLDFQSGALGDDVSGNNNDWTLNNMSTTTDVVLDSPSDNYAVLNPLRPQLAAGVTYTNANLTVYLPTNISYYPHAFSNMGVSSGKFYWEVNIASYGPMIGIGDLSDTLLTNWFATNNGSPNSVVYASNGNLYYPSTVVSGWGATFTGGDVIGVALDMDAGTITFYKNNVSQGVARTGLSGEIFAGINIAGSESPTTTFNFGQESFAYTPPTGFNKLSTTNLPDSTIKNGSDYFQTVLRNGFGGTGGTVATNFQADLIWEKPRNLASGHFLIDSVRGIASGTAPYLSSNLTQVEANANWYEAPTSSTIGFNSNDYASSTTLVDWIWKANGSGVNNTDGSITSTVSANPTAGFSIVTYTGDGGADTIGHGLGVAPKFIITKTRSIVNAWHIYHASVGAGYRIFFSTSVPAASSTVWNNTSPTSTVFSVGDANTNGSGTTMAAYCFAEVPGYSSFGSYTGNGLADGPFVYTGFRPAWLMIKKVTGSVNVNAGWILKDATRDIDNVVNANLQAESAGAEYTSGSEDFLSNGFKIRTNNIGQNTSGETYIYMAFAENPFKNSNAR
jgi:hypothetical protein